MNFEPPTGDDLQRMLVSMKHAVLADAEAHRPRPKRRGRRTGIVVGVLAVLALGATSSGVALGMIPQPFAAAPAPTPTAHPTEPTTTPTPSSAPIVTEPTRGPTETPVAGRSGTIPSDCRAAVPSSEYDRLFGAIPLENAGGSTWGTDTTDLVPDLYCVWIDPLGDGSFLSIGFGRVDAGFAGWDGTLDGWTCSDRDQGRFCQIGSAGSTTETFFSRGDTWVHIRQFRVPTNGLLRAVQQQVWG